MNFIQFFGHGRALEAYLVGVKILFGLFIVPPQISIQILVLSDLQWFIPDPLIAAPFFIVGAMQGIGLWLNAKGYECSWIIRASGALSAILLWSALLTKSVLIGALVSGMTPFLIMSLLGSVFILWKALNKLPVPGAVGLL